MVVTIAPEANRLTNRSSVNVSEVVVPRAISFHLKCLSPYALIVKIESINLSVHLESVSPNHPRIGRCIANLVSFMGFLFWKRDK